MNKRQINKRIGQIEASQYEMEQELSDEEFRDYCDAVSTCLTYLKNKLKEKS